MNKDTWNGIGYGILGASLIAWAFVNYKIEPVAKQGIALLENVKEKNKMFVQIYEGLVKEEETQLAKLKLSGDRNDWTETTARRMTVEQVLVMYMGDKSNDVLDRNRRRLNQYYHDQGFNEPASYIKRPFPAR
jgi:hypothetical protein